MRGKAFILTCVLALTRATGSDAGNNGANFHNNNGFDLTPCKKLAEGTFIAHENCNQYYRCSHGQAVAMRCPANLLYNPYREWCDWPQNVDCGDRVIPEPCANEDNCSGGDNSDENGNGNGSCNCNPDEAPEICSADGSDGTLVAHENCNQYNICDHGRPVVVSCPENLLYNPYTEHCDWPENVDCVGRVIPEDGDDNDNGPCNCNPEEAPKICAVDGSDGTLVAHENCNQFNICDHGRPVVMSCSGILLYNPYTKQCDWPENVDCAGRVIPEDGDDNDNDNGNGSCNCNPDEAPEICSADGSDGTLVAHENCNQYNICDHGRPVVVSCPENLLYNPYTEHCDWPENVDCVGRVIPEDGDDNDNGPCNCNPEEAPKICAVDGSDGTLVAHANCNQFNICDHGRPVVMSCSGTLLYNPYTKQCDWPKNVDCAGRVIPEDCDDNDNDNGNGSCNCNPDEAPEICAADGSDGTLVAHENCNQFNICDHGRPVVMSCPGILLYNPYTEHCDWPENVDCAGRVIPEDCDDNDNGPCNCNPDEAPEICAADGSDGTLVAHENCNQYNICDHGLPVALSCPGILLYNPYTEKCDWPESVNCNGRVIP